ncbi:MAG: radical SAM protein [Anaerolineaceae bacterium]
MIQEINERTLASIQNPVFRDYARQYVNIYQDFLSQVSAMGIELAPEEDAQIYQEETQRMAGKGAVLRNDAKSVVVNRISPGCEACQTSVGSATFFVSLKCHRNCFFCFNPNQENYDYFCEHKIDVVKQLKELHDSGQTMDQLALTGGEPLLFKSETIRFFQAAREYFPQAATRLYTSGDQIDEETLQQLKTAGLDEIRFSIRMYDLEKGRQFTLERIALAKAYIPRVMVEMPILPGTLDEMKSILLRLDEIGVFGINLLELCFPFNNVDEFRQRGYHVKARPFRVLYDYWYAGGLPIAESETVCLQLVDFALQAGLKMGVHYCSLENKHTGQVYQQNKTASHPSWLQFSENDYFFRSAKVFGEDVPRVKKIFAQHDFADYDENTEWKYLEFPINKINWLKKTAVEIGISTQIAETRSGEKVLRELKIDWTTPQIFKYKKDI